MRFLRMMGSEQMDLSVMYLSEKDNWETPQNVFDELNDEFKFTLDPCADDINHKCENYFTKEINGLKKSWGGQRVFCNPPYGKEISKWCEKCLHEFNNGCDLIVMLIPARTDTKWFHNYIYNYATIRFVKGRIHFGNSKQPAPFPSLVAIFERKQNE